MAETNGNKRGPGRPPGSKNKPKQNTTKKNEVMVPPTKTERIEQMQSRYDRDRRNLDVIWSITLGAMGLFLFFTVVMDSTGAFGSTVHDICMGLFGLIAYVLPFIIMIFAILMIMRKLQHAGGRTLIFMALIFINLCILNSYRFIDENNLAYGFGDIANYYVTGVDGYQGGAIGMELGVLLVKFFGKPGLLIISGSLLFISFFLVANTPISRFFENWAKKREMRRILNEMEERELAESMEHMDTKAEYVGQADPAESSRPSIWKSIMNGIAKADDPVEIPPARDNTQAEIEPPLSSIQARKAAPADRDPSGMIDYKDLPEQKDDSVINELSRDTLFGRIARKFGAGRTEQVKDTVTTGLLPETEQDDTEKIYEQEHKSYGLVDPDGMTHSGSYGLAGTTGTAQSGRGLAAAAPAVISPEVPDTPAARVAAPKKTVKKTPEKVQPARETEIPDVNKDITKDDNADDAALADSFNAASNDSAYELPPLSLLRKSSGPKQLMSDVQLEQKADLLEKTLNDFGVDAKVLKVTQGASVTRYEVQPATGVKVSSITKLADDIALNLRAKSIRIEAPIPGKAAVGIEVENDKPSPVMMRELIESEEFENSDSKITFVVGKDISGNNVVADLKGMPHLLIAGATGSGKSVCINTIIASFLYKAKPSELKLIMIDPKVVELANYNGIPHMLTPVVTDPRKAARALAIAVEEMDKRYELFAKEGVKDLESYNELMIANHEYASCKPQVVIIIDELADLMMAAPADVENSICRLAQKARAAGMHLIVATQRPSVNVVTGLIKANIPSRIAFSVASQFDSRTILDMAGAEKLLGKGDMLFSPVGSSKPYRIQGPFITDSETEKLIKFVKKEGGTPDYDEELSSAIESSERKGNSEPQDELTEEAIAFIFKSKQASVSMLQRKFRIGYNRAARIIDEIEDKGIIGPSDGSRPRQLLITEDQYYSGSPNAAAAEEISKELSPQEKAELEQKVIGRPHMNMMSAGRQEAAPETKETQAADPADSDYSDVDDIDSDEDNKSAEQAAIDYFNSLPENVRQMILNSNH